jgi:predicted GNAT family acetyltransferase
LNTRGRLLKFGSVTERPPVQGVLRLAGPADAALARTWGAAASIDSGVAALDGQLCAQLASAKMLYFWGDGQPRCMLGLLRETRASAAVGVVYTPAAFRGQGQATAALGALCDLLDERGVPNRYLWIDPASDAAQALAHKLSCSLVHDSLDIDCT